MPDATLASIARRLRSALTHAAWTQWAALGMPAAGARAARSIVDPEGLVLGSLWLGRHEKRLARLLRLWAGSDGVRLLSAQRARNLVSRFPAGVGEGLPEFAAEALVRGKDARWRTLARRARPGSVGWKSGEAASAAPEAPGALMLRLRLALGVGIKADVLAYLIGLSGARVTVREVTDALGYQSRAVRRALEELAAARFIAPVPTAAVSYRIEEERWNDFLGLGEEGAGGWWHWSYLYAFGAALDAAATAATGQSPYLQSSRARDLIGEHRKTFVLVHVPLSDPADHPGEAYLPRLRQDVEDLARRVEKNWA